MKTAAEWKRFYATERGALGGAGLDAMLDRTPVVDGAAVFPHTLLAATGSLVAAVADAVVRSGADRVLALGVLHGAREADAELVRRARAGEPTALAALRRVHRGGEDGHAAEEFSLDGFAALLARAARRAGRRPPTLLARYPFLVGEEPGSLPGLEELEAIAASGCPVVATTDPIHHGAGYGTPERERRRADDPSTAPWACGVIRAQLDAIEDRRWSDFQRAAAAVRSDFRDVGPVLGTLWPVGRLAIAALSLVDYHDALPAPPPTWVGAALLARAAQP